MINESGLWDKLRPWLSNYGVPTRIESAVTSGLPDIIYSSGGTLILLELKIERSGTIKMPIFQYSWARKNSHQLAPHYHWVAVLPETSSEVKFYKFETLLPHIVSNENQRTMYAYTDSVGCDYLVNKMADVSDWLSYIEEAEFNFNYSYED